ncbi:MAG: nicotinate-nucleotide adenylyltransferase [Lachnospiraceae bacterium]
MVNTGVIYSRFKIVHLKHLEYILAAKMGCQRLYVGITYPDDADSTYIQRYEMIHDALLDIGVRREDFEIIPFPVEQPEMILQYAPREATYLLSIGNEQGEEQKKLLEDLGLTVEVLWRREIDELTLMEDEIKECMRTGREWSHLVPKTVYQKF